ncbi:SRPBCC domain-containing protein [Massilia scottii]|uniref:SRPBCC domain-containing protein n=1 Tax=Massilia scottii TaxID=3057166 RepID=UPI0027969F8C|nr:SRPBCC domain-containing protein [Massilia sp. CCM 9029]MDQ1830738.1 SRPBCC domain-containing protein [Massilia sp. CCM 9029]
MVELVARAKMPIRCTATQAFDAFVQPDRITSFWLTSASAPLGPGAQVAWQFMVAGASECVNVTAFERPRHIAFTWTGSGLFVDISLAEQGGMTVVGVEVRGFGGDDAMDQIVNATEGFSIVLCDLKVFLESGRPANLVRDKAALIERARDA